MTYISISLYVLHQSASVDAVQLSRMYLMKALYHHFGFIQPENVEWNPILSLISLFLHLFLFIKL